MFYALGLLTACILALVVAPPLWRRAVRLNRRSIEETMPMTWAEIQAEKDQIRAAFAVSTRRLDVTIEKLENQVTEQLIDINRKREIISHLTAEGSMSAEDMIALEQERDRLRNEVAAQKDAIAEAAKAAGAQEKRMAALQQTLDEAQGKLDAIVSERETQRMEIVARDTELDNLRDSVAAVKTTTTVEEVARAGLETELSQLRTSLALEKRKLADTEALVAEAEARRVGTLAEIAARDAEIAGVRDDLAEARTKIEGLSLRLVEAEAAGMTLLAVEESKAELEARLAHMETVNARLETDLAELRAASAKASEEETALLRSKLIDIGAAVARLAAKGEASNLVAIVPDEAAKPKPAQATDEPGANEDQAGDEPSAPISLAERIRALQHAGGGL